MTEFGGSNGPPLNWEFARVPLKFQFGEIVLGRASMSLFRRNAQLDERPLQVGEAPEPPPQLDGADGYVVWSHPIATRLPVLTRRGGRILYAPRQYRRFSVDLSGEFAHYMAAFSGKTRSGLRRKLRKFAAVSGGRIDWRQYRTPEELHRFFPLARMVSAKTYQERLLHLGLPDTKMFIASSLALSKADDVRAYLLFLQNEPISYLYCSINQQVVAYDYLGYDPTYSLLSPGTVLQLLALEALFGERKFITFDFTEGEGPHKELFSTASRLCGDVYVVAERFFPASAIMLHYAADRLSTGAGMVLDYLKLRSSFRRLIRGI